MEKNKRNTRKYHVYILMIFRIENDIEIHYVSKSDEGKVFWVL